jgi:hypothetical protein
MDTLSNKKEAKSSNKYNCILCDFSTSRKSNIEKHYLTRKHLSKSEHVTLSNKKEAKSSNIITYICENCNKEYKNRTGLWRHKKSCI